MVHESGLDITHLSVGCTEPAAEDPAFLVCHQDFEESANVLQKGDWHVGPDSPQNQLPVKERNMYLSPKPWI